MHQLFQTLLTETPVYSTATAVAMKLSEQAHGLELRRKPPCGPQIFYKHHPLLCYKILLAHGVTDEATLMAALLHDTLEPTSDPNQPGRYVEKPVLMTSDLEQHLSSAGIAESRELSKRVVDIIDELTLTESDAANKLKHQIEHASRYSQAALLIKMADHCATLMEDLFVPPADELEKRALNIERAATIAQICHENSEKRNPDKSDASNVVSGQLFDFSKRLIELSRRGAAVDEAQKVAVLEALVESLEWRVAALNHPVPAIPDSQIVFHANGHEGRGVIKVASTPSRASSL